MYYKQNDVVSMQIEQINIFIFTNINNTHS